MIPRDEIVSIAREAGFAQSWSEAAGEALERFAALVAAKVIARTPPPPLVVSMSDVDQAKLAAMLAKRQPMPMVAAPDDSELAACFDQIKSDLIADGATVAPIDRGERRADRTPEARPPPGFFLARSHPPTEPK